MKNLNIYVSKTGLEKGNIVKYIESKLFKDYSTSINYSRGIGTIFIPIALKFGGSPKNIFTRRRNYEQ